MKFSLKNKNERLMTVIMIILLITGTSFLFIGINNISKEQEASISAKALPIKISNNIGRPTTVAIDIEDYCMELENMHYRFKETERFWREYDEEHGTSSSYKLESVNTRGSRLNLLNPSGNYIVEPIDYYSPVYNLSEVKEGIIKSSFYENTWRGEAGKKQCEIIVPKPTEWELDRLGIAWASLYLMPNFIDIIDNGDWSRYVDEDGFYDAYLLDVYSGYPDNRQLMPFLNRPFLRKYYYNIYASNNCYDWTMVARDLTSQQTMPKKFCQREDLYEPAEIWVNNNPYKKAGFMPPSGHWEHDSWNDIEYVNIPSAYSHYTYYKIQVTNVLRDDGYGQTGSVSMIQNGGVFIEIGEIVFDYSITKEETDQFFNGCINTPHNNSYYQLSPYDEVPIEISAKGITNNINNDPSIENISFYINNNKDKKFALLSRETDGILRNPLIPIPNVTINYNEKGWKNVSDPNKGNGYFGYSPHMVKWADSNIDSSWNDAYDIEVNATSQSPHPVVYDIGILVNNHGNNEQHSPLSINFTSEDSKVISRYDVKVHKDGGHYQAVHHESMTADPLNIGWVAEPQLQYRQSYWNEEQTSWVLTNQKTTGSEITNEETFYKDISDKNINVNDGDYMIEIMFKPNYDYSAYFALTILFENDVEYIYNLSQSNLNISCYYTRWCKLALNIPKEGVIEAIRFTGKNLIKQGYYASNEVYISDVFITKYNPIPDQYDPKFIIDQSGNKSLIFDHNMFISGITRYGYLDYRYDYDVIKYEITKPSSEGYNLDYQFPSGFLPNYDYWMTNDNYGLSLQFDLGTNNNPIYGRTSQGNFENINFTTQTTGDNFLFLSFVFGGTAYGTIDKNYTVLMLIKGDPTTVDKLNINYLDSDPNRWTDNFSLNLNSYQEFIDSVNSTNFVYTTDYVTDDATFCIENFETLCDYLVIKNNLSVFDDINLRADWMNKKHYAIRNITFYSVINNYKRIEIKNGIGDKAKFISDHSAFGRYYFPMLSDRKILRYDAEFYQEKQTNKYKLYAVTESIETMNDTLSIGKIRLYHTPKANNLFTTFKFESTNKKLHGYGSKTEDYLMNGVQNPRKVILTRDKVYPQSHYTKLSEYYDKELLIKVGSIVIDGNSSETFKISISSVYNYLGQSIGINNFEMGNMYQYGSVLIKDIIVIPRAYNNTGSNLSSGELDYVYYNNRDLFYPTLAFADDDAQLGKVSVIRNAFSDAAYHNYQRQFNLESTLTTAYRNDNPKRGDYVEISLNMPVSGHYDIYLRDSLILSGFVPDMNRYSVSINGREYRKYSRQSISNGLLDNMQREMYVPSLTGRFSLSYASYGQRIPIFSSQIHVASDFFKAGRNVLRISFDAFESYRRYNSTTGEYNYYYSTDLFSLIAYDQVLLYYRADPTISIPVSEFLASNPNPQSNAHTITTEIVIKDEYVERLGGQKVLNYTTTFYINVKPIINFQESVTNELIYEYYNKEITEDHNYDTLKQLQQIRDNNPRKLIAYVLDPYLNQSSLKYRLNYGLWKSWDKITENNSMYRLEKTFDFVNENLNEDKNIIEIIAENIFGGKAFSFLVFYYDITPPDITILNSSIDEMGNVPSKGYVNFTIRVEDNQFIRKICYSNGLLSTNDLVGISGRARDVKQNVVIFDREYDRVQTKIIEKNVSISVNEIEQGETLLYFTAEDMAGNVKEKTFRVNKLSTFLNVNFSEPDWRYIERDVPIKFNATNYILTGSDIEYFESLKSGMDWIRFGYGDSVNIYDQIEHVFNATENSLTKVGILLQTPTPSLKDFASVIEIKKDNVVLSRAYVYPSTISDRLLDTGTRITMRIVDIPDVLLQVGELYSIVITPFEAPYNIMNLRSYTYNEDVNQRLVEENLYGKTYGYHKGVKVSLDSCLYVRMYGKTTTPVQQADNVEYQLNNNAPVGGFTNGIIDTTISYNESRYYVSNNLTVTVDNGAGYLSSYYKNFRWLTKNDHTPPKAHFLSPSPNSNQRSNFSIEIEFDYPEYNETYDIQFYIQKTNKELVWIQNYTVSEDTKTNRVMIILDTNQTVDGVREFEDSTYYKIIVRINDGYDMYETDSGYFTINNDGPSVLITSPRYNARRNYNVVFEGNITVYGVSQIIKAWVYFNNDPSIRFELVHRNVYDGFGFKTYTFLYNLPIRNLKEGTNTIHFYSEDQYGRKGEHIIEIIRDVETSVKIEDRKPNLPNPYEDTIVYYEVLDDYKEITVFLAYSEVNGNSGFKKVATLKDNEITGEINLGVLNLGKYNVIIIVQDEADNTATIEQQFEVTESGVLMTIGEKIGSIILIISGVFSLGISIKMIKNRAVSSSGITKFKAYLSNNNDDVKPNKFRGGWKL